ncbi:MAG: BrnA antitoxin family protein [Acidobacteria bacterium]|nr:BrnA antitoxin family protein [Acidobacteriota bacterium]
MNKRSSSKASRTDWKRLRAMKDADIQATAEHPEADVRHIVRDIVRRGLKPVGAKASVSLRVDADVLELFKRQGPGYQTRMNAVLRAFRDVSA